jgi:hypothetical protein
VVSEKNFSNAKPQRHRVTVGVQNFESLHFCLLLETVTKNKSLLPNLSFLTGLTGSGIQVNAQKESRSFVIMIKSLTRSTGGASALAPPVLRVRGKIYIK